MSLLGYTYRIGKLYFGPIPGTYGSKRDAIRSAKARAKFGGDWVVDRYDRRGRSSRVWRSWVTL